jgi:hypothetical protein
MGPTCPGPQRQGAACEAPLEARFVVYDAGGEETAAFETGPDGRFGLALAPGAYRIVPDLENPILASQEKDVDVVADTVTVVTLVFDTGIR